MLNIVKKGTDILKGMYREYYFKLLKHFRDTIIIKTETGLFKIYTKDEIIPHTLFVHYKG